MQRSTMAWANTTRRWRRPKGNVVRTRYRIADLAGSSSSSKRRLASENSIWQPSPMFACGHDKRERNATGRWDFRGDLCPRRQRSEAESLYREAIDHWGARVSDSTWPGLTSSTANGYGETASAAMRESSCAHVSGCRSHGCRGFCRTGEPNWRLQAGHGDADLRTNTANRLTAQEAPDRSDGSRRAFRCRISALGCSSARIPFSTI